MPFFMLLQNLKGDTPLHVACRGCWPAVMQLLIQAGADALIPNQLGHTALVPALLEEFFW